MSAPAAGARIQNQHAKMTENARLGVVTHDQDREGNVQGGAAAFSFPNSFSAASPRDEIVDLKRQLMDDGGMSPFGQVQFTERDARWLLEKQQASEQANFDSWFGKQFHKNDVASRQFAQQIYPGYYEDRERKMTERAKLALRINLIKLRGPQNEEDLITLYGLQSGKIRLEEGWDRIGVSYDKVSDQTGPTAEERFSRGLLSVRKFLSQAERTGNLGTGENPFGSASTSDPFKPAPEARVNAPPNSTMFGSFLNSLGQ